MFGVAWCLVANAGSESLKFYPHIRAFKGGQSTPVLTMFGVNRNLAANAGSESENILNL